MVELMNNRMVECSVYHSKLSTTQNKTVVRAYEYDRHKSKISSKHRALKVLLVVGDCMLDGLQITDSQSVRPIVKEEGYQR